MLGTGLGNPPAVGCLASGWVGLGSRPGQKPDPVCLGRVVTRTGHKSADSWPGWNRPAVPYSGSYNFGHSLATIKFLGSDRIMS